jgi:hypothetical protein
VEEAAASYPRSLTTLRHGLKRAKLSIAYTPLIRLAKNLVGAGRLFDDDLSRRLLGTQVWIVPRSPGKKLGYGASESRALPKIEQGAKLGM